MMIVRDLFSAYQNWLGGDLCFQDYQAELDGLPGDYASPTGCLLLARRDTEVFGVVAVRTVPEDGSASPTRCEMKRLFVLSEVRGKGVGRDLAVASLAFARTAGYQSMVLETLEELTAARDLYRALGFVQLDYEPGQAIPMELKLDQS